MSEYVVDEAKNLLPLDEFGALLPLYMFSQSTGEATFYLMGFSEDFQIGDTFRVSFVENVLVNYVENQDNFQIWLFNITNYGLRVSSPNFSMAISDNRRQNSILVSDFELDWSASMNKGQNINKILDTHVDFSYVGGAVCSLAVTFTRTA